MLDMKIFVDLVSGLAIQHFAACGGELVHLVYLVRRTRETRQTRTPDRLLLAEAPGSRPALALLFHAGAVRGRTRDVRDKRDERDGVGLSGLSSLFGL